MHQAVWSGTLMIQNCLQRSSVRWHYRDFNFFMRMGKVVIRFAQVDSNGHMASISAIDTEKLKSHSLLVHVNLRNISKIFL